MKHILIWTLLITGLLITLKCTKESMPEPQIVETQILQATYYADEFDIKSLRDGDQLPFDFPVSQSVYDPWTNSQTAYNIQKIDTVIYTRVTEPQVNFYDTTWDIYDITRYFTDSTSITIRAYAPSNGNTYIIAPLTGYNQLSVSNPYNYIKLQRTTVFQPYFDEHCGKDKRQFQYNVFYGSQVRRQFMRGDRCASNVYSYQLIY